MNEWFTENPDIQHILTRIRRSQIYQGVATKRQLPKAQWDLIWPAQGAVCGVPQGREVLRS